MACYGPENRQQRRATWSGRNPGGRWRDFGYDALVARDNCSLDLFGLKDESLLDADSLPDPEVIAEEIAEALHSAFDEIEEIRDLRR